MLKAIKEPRIKKLHFGYDKKFKKRIIEIQPPTRPSEPSIKLIKFINPLKKLLIKRKILLIKCFPI